MSIKALLTSHSCPFCGGRDLHIVNAVYEIGFYTACLGCEAQGPVAESQPEALEKWETRPNYAEVLYFA